MKDLYQVGERVLISENANNPHDRGRIGEVQTCDMHMEECIVIIHNPLDTKGFARLAVIHFDYLKSPPREQQSGPVTDLHFMEQALADDAPSFMEKAGLDLSDAQVKDSNPKDGCGAKKPPLSYIPRPVLYEVGNALFEGSRKYGAYNWRIAGVRASIYQDACGRHIDAWQEGQDLDPDSGVHHLSKAIAGLMVIRDAMICDKFVDDRPPSAPADWMEKAQAQTDAIIERHPTSKAPYTQIQKDAGAYD